MEADDLESAPISTAWVPSCVGCLPSSCTVSSIRTTKAGIRRSTVLQKAQHSPGRRKYQKLGRQYQDPFKAVAFQGGFTLVDIDVAKVVPAEAMEPFAKELAAREARRERRAALEADKRLQETAREAAVAAAAAAPDASALLAMPKLGRQAVLTAEEQELEAALQQSLAEAAAELPGTSPPAPVQGISFASMTRMGYAATGPIPGGKSSSPPASVWTQRPGGFPAAAQGSAPQGPWGGTEGAPGNLAARLSAAASAAQQQQQQGSEGAQPQGSGKKGRKTMVLLSTGQRRY